MLRLSKKAEYALMALKDLASRPEAEAASAREIAERYGIPIELMAKVLQRLVRQDLLASQHGTRGGYQLSRSAPPHLGGRRHRGHRRPGDGHRLHQRRRRLRAVRHLQHP